MCTIIYNWCHISKNFSNIRQWKGLPWSTYSRAANLLFTGCYIISLSDKSHNQDATAILVFPYATWWSSTCGRQVGRFWEAPYILIYNAMVYYCTNKRYFKLLYISYSHINHTKEKEHLILQFFLKKLELNFVTNSEANFICKSRQFNLPSPKPIPRTKYYEKQTIR